MAKTIMELFKDRKSELYTSSGPLGGISGKVLIESRGLINPPRQAALLLASPNAIGDLIGSAGGALLGGNANRPSDTIFKNNSLLSKPISVIPTVAQLRNAIEPDKNYFVKTEPSPGANIANFIKNAVKSPAAAQTAALQLVSKLGSKNALKNVKDYFKLLSEAERGKNYGPAYEKDTNGKLQRAGYFYSKHFIAYEEKPNEYSKGGNAKEYVRVGLKSRSKDYIIWDTVSNDVLTAAADEKTYEASLEKIDKDNTNVQQTFVKFRTYGKTLTRGNDIVLPGTISGISEDFAPEINSFKYVGSPFNLYRYGGVERTLKFDVKMYYLDNTSKISMINNLNRLRKLVFPDENISVATYPGDKQIVSQLFFAPNLVYLTINGLYENILGIIDSLSFSIDDNTSWATTVPNYFDGSTEKPYPTVINVSIGMKIIEHPAISKDNKFVYGENKEGKTQYANYFTEHNNPISLKQILPFI
jgi:hypothetical protein